MGKSRCTQPQDPPLQWVEVLEPATGVEYVLTEFLAVANVMPKLDKGMFFSEFKNRLKAAASGRLDPGAQPTPISHIAQSRNLPAGTGSCWELRWGRGPREFRLYHVEETSHPERVVSCLFHEKNLHPEMAPGKAKDDAISNDQNVQIGEALRRFGEEHPDQAEPAAP